MFSTENFAVRIAEGGNDGGGPPLVRPKRGRKVLKSAVWKVLDGAVPHGADEKNKKYKKVLTL